MKCPYRPVTKISENITTTDFAECYGIQCPWYCPEHKYNGFTQFEACYRVSCDDARAKAERDKYKR